MLFVPVFPGAGPRDPGRMGVVEGEWWEKGIDEEDPPAPAPVRLVAEEDEGEKADDDDDTPLLLKVGEPARWE